MIRNCTKYNLSDWDSERFVDQLIIENDDTYFDCPTIDLEPDLLISKVRQHYMKHMVKLLSVNYETNQKLLNKNIYLPSGIWRCAKTIEMKAAQKSMAIQLYRTQIMSVINEVKKDTERGKLYRNLLETIRTPPNDKKTQTSVGSSTECDCKCHNHDSKRRRKSTTQILQTDNITAILHGNTNATVTPQGNTSALHTHYKIPVALNMQTHTPEPVVNNRLTVDTSASKFNSMIEDIPPIPLNATEMKSNLPVAVQPLTKIMTPMHENDSDAIMMQLEKLFQTEQNDDDLFDATFNIETKIPHIETHALEDMKKVHDSGIDNSTHIVQVVKTNDAVIENHAAQIRSLDERLAALTGILINSEPNIPEHKEEKNKHTKQKEVKKKKIVSKWHCEEYFLKKELYETLYQIGDANRNKLSRIKTLYLQLFGEDEDNDEGIMSPMEESPHLILSCKTRISMWVLTTLTPYYGMGRIRGKNLFKSVVKYLIDLIFKCKQYPDKREVRGFVKDFIQNHAMITCEADYRDIIDNVKAAPYTFA